MASSADGSVGVENVQRAERMALIGWILAQTGMGTHFHDLSTGYEGSCSDSDLTLPQLEFCLTTLWPDWEDEVGCEGCRTVWDTVSVLPPPGIVWPAAYYDPCYFTYHGGGGEGATHCARYVPSRDGKAGVVQCSIARVTSATACRSHDAVGEELRAEYAYVHWGPETSGSGHSGIDQGTYERFDVVNRGQYQTMPGCSGTSGDDRYGFGVVGTFSVDMSPCGDRKIYGYWAAGIGFTNP